MPARSRSVVGGVVYHVLNRGNARMRIFEKDADYAAFEKVLAQGQQRESIRLLAYCLLPNHWHLVLWPRAGADRQLSEYMRWVTVTHTQRWHAHRHSSGSGHLYQGRFKSFPVKDDAHLLSVCRYVERNALRGNLVERAEAWRWGSLWRTRHEADGEAPQLAAWPVDRPRNWVWRVNQPESEPELAALRRSVVRGAPYGDEIWSRRMAERLNLAHTQRPRGRPRKVREK